VSNFKKLTLLAVLGLITSNVSFAQDSLRDRFRDQNQPKSSVYAEGFKESLADYQQTWETILSNSDLYIIFERLPNEKMTGARYSSMPTFSDLFAVFKSGDNIFAPLLRVDRQFLWKDAEYECSNLKGFDRLTYVEPLALTNSSQDGFAQFRSRFETSSLYLKLELTNIDFEINFDSGECYFSRENFVGLPPEVKQCTVRKYNRDDQQLSVWDRGINEKYDSLLSTIQEIASSRGACLQSE
jgi:hypothetical protein